MKYCINYIKRNFKYLNDIDEITIFFRPSDSSLIEFMLSHANQTINIFIQDEQDFIENNRIKLFKAIKNEHPELNFTLKISRYDENKSNSIIKIIQEAEIPYFFNTGVRDWATFRGYLALKPCAMYITDNLGFEIKQCAEAAHAERVSIRIIPNAAQGTWDKAAGITKFFVRPEDVKVYESYVDVMELFGTPDMLATYYRIYAIDKKWFGDLGEIIINFNDSLDSRNLLPSFAERRLNCGQKCLKDFSCKICAAQKTLSDVLIKNKLSLITIKKK